MHFCCKTILPTAFDASFAFLFVPPPSQILDKRLSNKHCILINTKVLLIALGNTAL